MNPAPEAAPPLVGMSVSGARRLALLQHSQLTALRDLLVLRSAAERQEAGRMDPIRFGQVYAPRWFPLATPPFHWRMVQEAVKRTRYVVAAPIGTGKTVLLTKLLPLWSLLAEGTEWHLLISNSNQMAAAWLNDVRMMVESSDELRSDFDVSPGTHWADEELEFQIGAQAGSWPFGTRRRGLIQARGRGCQVRGMHPDRIILDDPQSDDDLRSEGQVTAFEEWFRGALLGRLDTAEKKLAYVGTAITDQALVAKLVMNPPAGWICEAFSILDDQDRSIWPEKFPEDDLERRRAEMGEERFAADFMNAPLRRVRARRLNCEKLRVEALPPIHRHSYLTLTLDPSFTAGGDAWVLTVIEQTWRGMWNLRDRIAERSGTGPMMEALWSLWAKYERRLDAMGIEIGATQNALQYLVEEAERARKVRLPITWLRHSVRAGKAQRIEALGAIIEAGRLVVSPDMPDVRHQIMAWRAGAREDNLLDSLAMHLELQRPRTPRVATPVTREEEIRTRYEGYRDVLTRLRAGTRPAWHRQTDRYARFLPGGNA